MNDLIERIEAASGPDREIDRKIMLASGYRYEQRYIGCRDEDGTRELDWVYVDIKTDQWRSTHPLSFTASIDAALTLVPEGWWLAGLHFCHPDFRSEQDKEWCAELAGPVTWSVIDREVGEEPLFEHVCASAATPALALCAAALKSRAYLKETSNGQ